MDSIYKYDITVFSIIILLVVLVSIYLKKDTLSSSSKLYKRLLLVSILMLVLEFLSWQFNGRTGVLNYRLNYIFNTIYEWALPLLTCIWASYIDYSIFKSIKRLKKRMFYIFPMFLSGLIVIINFFTPIVFFIDSNNIYHRGKYIWIMLVMSLLVFMYMWLLAIKNWKKLDKEVVASMLLFVIMPLIGAVIQLCLYGPSILWPMMSIAVIGTYIFLETLSTSKDYLTGLISRHRVDNYIDYLLEENLNFALLMFDLNDFKIINDTHGHLVGDIALKAFSQALKNTFKQARFVGRYAGDEFIVGITHLSESELKDLKSQLLNEVKRQQHDYNLSFNIKFSLGYHEKHGDENLNYESVLSAVDKKMYINKSEMKKVM